MKRYPLLLAALALLAVSTSGCDFIGDVIEFSLWTILIIVVAVVLIIAVLIKQFID